MYTNGSLQPSSLGVSLAGAQTFFVFVPSVGVNERN